MRRRGWVSKWSLILGVSLAVPALAGEAERVWALKLKQAPFSGYPQSELAQAFAAFQRAYSQMDAFLRAQTTEIERGWREHLNTRLLAEVVAGKTVSAYELDQNLWWYFRNKPGLDLPQLVAVREAGRRYSDALKMAATSETDLRRQFEMKRDRLADLLAEAATQPLSVDTIEIGQLVGWMERAHQVKGWIPAIRQTFERPNVQYSLSSKLLLNAFQPQNIDRAEPVTDYFRGTTILGNTEFHGTTQAVLTPNPAQGNIDVVLTGTANTKSQGFNRGAIINSTSTTAVTSVARLVIQPRGFTMMPAVTSAHTESTLESTSYHPNREFRLPLVERVVKRVGAGVAMKQAKANQADAEVHASQVAQARFTPELDREVNERVGKRLQDVNKLYTDNFYLPFYRHDVFPKQFAFRTLNQRISATATLATYGQFGNVSPAPALPADSDVTVQLHESAINNFVEAAYGWFVASDEYVENFAKTLYGELPQELWVYKGSERWSLEFERFSPFTLHLGQDRLDVKFRIEKFVRIEKKQWLPVALSASYRIKREGEKFLFVRDGAPKIDFGQNPDLGEEARRDLVAFASPKLAALVPEAPTFPNLMLPEGVTEGQLPALENTRLTLGNSWLTGSWKVVPKKDKPKP